MPRGRAGPGLLAHVIVPKFAEYLPLYRQSQVANWLKLLPESDQDSASKRINFIV